LRRAIVDTGPIVALLSSRDGHHAWAREVLRSVEPPMQTCEAVISEACFLLRKVAGGPDAVLQLVERGIVQVSFRLAVELAPVRALVERYRRVPMSLADACLVRMTELDTRSTVITVDRDFLIYRRNGRQTVPALMP